MAFSLNGCGTSYRGVRYLPDGSYITTIWITALWIPIIPLRSVRVLNEEERWGGAAFNGRKFSSVPAPLDFRTISQAYAIGIGAIVAMVFLNYLAEKLL